jgi:arylsulfatase A-like enzyme
LRTDHLGTYGYPLDTSPNIDRLAAAGTLVERCLSTAPETAPGTASLITGLYQDSHTVVYNRRTLPDDVQTLAERLSEVGYRSAAFIGNFLVGPKFGFDQGFDVAETFEGVIPVAPRDELGTTAALEWLTTQRARTDPAPWFLWVHYLDPHGPYTPLDTTWIDAVEYDPAIFGADLDLEIAESNFGLGIIPHYQRFFEQKRPSQYFRRYDGEIRNTDRAIGRLLEDIDESGDARSTLVVLTADHGESLVEHDEYFQHGWFLYDTTLRIPLIFRLPGIIPERQRVTAEASAVDVVPTVLDILEIEAGEGHLDGRSLKAALTGKNALGSVPVFAYGPRDNHQFAVSMDGYKLIQTPAGAPEMQDAPPRPDAAERLELYWVADDPAETRELARDHPKFSELRGILKEYVQRFRHRYWTRVRELQQQRKNDH